MPEKDAPPCGLSPEQWAVYCYDANLQKTFPWIRDNNPLHISGDFGFQDMWERQVKEHPEDVRLAIEKAMGKRPPPLPSPQNPITPVPVENIVTLDLLKNIQKKAYDLAESIDKFINSLEVESVEPKKEEVKPDGNLGHTT